MQPQCSLGLIVIVVLLTSPAVGQKPLPTTPVAGKTAKAQIRTRSIDLTHVERLAGLPAATVIASPELCSSDGTLFPEIYGSGDKPGVLDFPEIYSISEGREVKKLSLKLPTEYQHMSLQSFYPGRNELVSLLQVFQPKAPDAEVKRGQKIFFLSVADRDGGEQKLVPLNLDFKPAKVAIFDSGGVVALGVDTLNLQPVLALLHADGSLDRRIDLDPRTYAGSQELDQIYQRKDGKSQASAPGGPLTGALNNAQFIPWGENILLVQPGSKLPVYELRDSGQLRAVTIKPPKGLMDRILPSDARDTWVMVTKDVAAFEKVANGGVVENPAESLYEVDPQTGEVIDQLSVKGPMAGEVACAAHGKLSLLYYGLPPTETGAEQMTYASAPR